MNLEPCPNCSTAEIQLEFKTTYGHGDSGYDHARYTCTGCGLAMGNKSDWGNAPTTAVIHQLATEWNKMAIKLKQ